MTKSFYLSILVALGLILPSVGFAHPDFSNKHDVQKVLHAMLMSIADNDKFPQRNNLKQTLSDGRRTYTIDVQKNSVFGPATLRARFILRSLKINELLDLFTLGLTYIPQFKPFRDMLELIEEAVAHDKFKLKLALKLAKNAKPGNHY